MCIICSTWTVSEYSVDSVPTLSRTNDIRAVSAETARELVEEYELPDVSDNREKNLNRFMQFCGVSYQLVPTASGSYVLAKVKVEMS